MFVEKVEQEKKEVYLKYLYDLNFDDDYRLNKNEKNLYRIVKVSIDGFQIPTSRNENITKNLNIDNMISWLIERDMYRIFNQDCFL